MMFEAITLLPTVTKYVLDVSYLPTHYFTTTPLATILRSLISVALSVPH
jgi:hypothetical protein